MLQNPDTGDIEAVAYSVDKEWEQKEEEIISAVTNREYDYIALINVKTRRIEYQYTSPKAVSTVYLRMADFDEAMSGALTALMYPEDLDDGLAAIALDHIEEVLKTEKEYSYSFRCRGNSGGGMGRVFPFLRATNEALEKLGVELPLPGQSATDRDTRLEAGIQAQVDIFGEGMRNFTKSGPEETRHINVWLAGNCFGDYYTRGGLDFRTREMLTFCFLAAQGGCEAQLTAHEQERF